MKSTTNVNELQAILTEKNAEVCLLIDSPFRILRVRTLFTWVLKLCKNIRNNSDYGIHVWVYLCRLLLINRISLQTQQVAKRNKSFRWELLKLRLFLLSRLWKRASRENPRENDLTLRKCLFLFTVSFQFLLNWHSLKLLSIMKHLQPIWNTKLSNIGEAI